MSDSETRIEELVAKLASRAGTETPMILLRLEVEFLTYMLQSVLGNVMPFGEERLGFLAHRLEQIVDEASKPKLVMP